jgi:hypothetical protein
MGPSRWARVARTPGLTSVVRSMSLIVAIAVVSPGIWVARQPRAGARYIYGVRGGRIRFVALTTAAELRSPARRPGICGRVSVAGEPRRV